MKKRILRVIILICIFSTFFALALYCEKRNELKAQDSFYQKLADGFDVNILIVGDSISEGAGASDDAHRWFNRMKQTIEDTYHVDVMINNVSLGGNTSYAGYVRTRLLQDGDIYDLAIVCFAENDAEEDFDLYYESVLRAIKEKCPSASIMTILESSQQGYTQKIQTVQQLSDYYNATVIDTIAAFQNSGQPYEVLAADSVHPSDAGQELYYNTIMKAIESGVDNHLGKPEPVEIPFDERVTMLDEMEYYALSELDCMAQENPNIDGNAGNDSDIILEQNTVDNIENPLVYVLDISEEVSAIGIDYVYAPDISGPIQVYVDGELVSEFDTTWNQGFYQRHIWILQHDITVEDSVEIHLSNPKQVEYLYGLILSK